jgi:hypothetical protein
MEQTKDRIMPATEHDIRKLLDTLNELAAAAARIKNTRGCKAEDRSLDRKYAKPFT